MYAAHTHVYIWQRSTGYSLGCSCCTTHFHGWQQNREAAQLLTASNSRHCFPWGSMLFIICWTWMMLCLRISYKMTLSEEVHRFVPFDPVAPCATIPGSPFSPFVPEGPTGPGSPSRPSLPSLPCCCTSKGTLPHSGEVVFFMDGATVGGATVALAFVLGSTVAKQGDSIIALVRTLTQTSYFLNLK